MSHAQSPTSFQAATILNLSDFVKTIVYDDYIMFNIQSSMQLQSPRATVGRDMTQSPWLANFAD